jgi:hypothetical protein
VNGKGFDYFCVNKCVFLPRLSFEIVVDDSNEDNVHVEELVYWLGLQL